MTKMGLEGFKVVSGDKTTSFWTARVQNSVVLNKLSHIQNDVVWVSDNLFKMTSFWFLIALNDVVLFCI